MGRGQLSPCLREMGVSAGRCTLSHAAQWQHVPTSHCHHRTAASRSARCPPLRVTQRGFNKGAIFKMRTTATTSDPCSAELSANLISHVPFNSPPFYSSAASHFWILFVEQPKAMHARALPGRRASPSTRNIPHEGCCT
jgi:hypothetical protein